MTNRDIVVHQCLHGYDDGHRLLASSVQLPPADAKAVLHFSDSAGSGIRTTGDEYITGYPLRAGLYALAKTWPAPEQPRPGCVWTHTILVDFADLAVVPDLSVLSSLFSRPSGNLSAYQKPLLVNDFEEPVDNSREPDMASILLALYQHPAERIVAPRADRAKSEDVAFGIWSQQWPRLRRSFRFCTNSTSDRSTEGHSFDLQFSGNESSMRSRFQKSRPASGADRPFPLWLELALEDLDHPDVSGLRTFLHGIGGDVEQGRRSFTQLVQLHADLQGMNGNFSLLANAINLLKSELRDVEALELRGSVVETASRHIPALDEPGVQFVVNNLPLLKSRSIDMATLGRDLMLRSPNLFRTMLSDDGHAGAVAQQGLKVATIDQVLKLAIQFPETLASVLASRPEIYRSVEFWKLPSIGVAAALKSADIHGHHDDVAKAVIAAGRTDLVKDTYLTFGNSDVLAVVAEQYSPDTAAGLSAWIAQGVRDLNSLGGVLASGRAWSHSFLSAVARLVHPDAVPNAFGDDPWLTAMRSTKDNIVDNFLRAYLLARALGPITRNSAELSVTSFALVHEATAKGWLGDDAWSMLSPRLPHALLGFDWDRCWRLRAALVDLFVDRRLSAKVMAGAGFDGELFFSLVHWAARTKRGREFMHSVADELRAVGAAARAKEVSHICEDKWPF